jgi:IS30 family transposase
VLGRPACTISREIARNCWSRATPGGVVRREYTAGLAQFLTDERAPRPRAGKLSGGRLREEVVARLRRAWSPQQVSADLARSFPDDEQMRVSPETIYQAIYVQGRGGLRAELVAQQALRSGHKTRHRQGRAAAGNRAWVGLNISQRPAEANDRAVPGHWEGDLIIGKDRRSQIATLVERSTRFVMLVALPDGRTSEHVVDELAAAMQTLPRQLLRSLTWDQGSELAAHATFTIATTAPVYFCDPHSPWQRGTNENTNGLLRQFLPKGTDLSKHTQADLNDIAELLNTRPRMTLNWDTPAQRLNQLLLR